jgi:hypothetical protein
MVGHSFPDDVWFHVEHPAVPEEKGLVSDIHVERLDACSFHDPRSKWLVTGPEGSTWNENDSPTPLTLNATVRAAAQCDAMNSVMRIVACGTLWMTGFRGQAGNCRHSKELRALFHVEQNGIHRKSAGTGECFT